MAMSRDLKVKSFTTVSGVQTQATPAYLADVLTTTPKQATAVLDGDVNVVTVTAASDSVTIPANLPAGTVFYVRGVTNAAVVFPPVGGNINGAGANTSVTLAVNVIHVCIVVTSGASSTYLFYKTAAL